MSSTATSARRRQPPAVPATRSSRRRCCRFSAKPAAAGATSPARIWRNSRWKSLRSSTDSIAPLAALE
eukprot:3287933-Prymnesium_polylepis.1